MQAEQLEMVMGTFTVQLPQGQSTLKLPNEAQAILEAMTTHVSACTQAKLAPADILARLVAQLGTPANIASILGEKLQDPQERALLLRECWDLPDIHADYFIRPKENGKTETFEIPHGVRNTITGLAIPAFIVGQNRQVLFFNAAARAMLSLPHADKGQFPLSSIFELPTQLLGQIMQGAHIPKLQHVERFMLLARQQTSRRFKGVRVQSVVSEGSIYYTLSLS